MNLRSYTLIGGTFLFIVGAPVGLGYYLSQQKASSAALKQEAAALTVKRDAGIDKTKVVPKRNYKNLPLSLQQLVEQYSSESLGESLERRIVVRKSDRTMDVYLGDELLKQYPISLGYNPVGDKTLQGDSRTPEGEFHVARKVPNSRYHKALLVSYPNKEHAKRGLQAEIITQEQYDSIARAEDNCGTPPQSGPLGGYIEIHGSGGGPDIGDWTLGCVALDNKYIDELFEFAETGCRRDGTPKTVIEILP